MHEIRLFNGELHYIPSEKFEAFKQAVNTSKFIEIGDSLINTSSIDRVCPAIRSVSEIQNAIIAYPSQYHEKLRKFVADREKEEKTTTPGNIRNYYEQVLI